MGESSSPTKEIWGLPWDQPWDDNLNLIMCFLFVPFAEAAAVKVGESSLPNQIQKGMCLYELWDEMFLSSRIVFLFQGNKLKNQVSLLPHTKGVWVSHGMTSCATSS